MKVTNVISLSRAGLFNLPDVEHIGSIVLDGNDNSFDVFKWNDQAIVMETCSLTGIPTYNIFLIESDNQEKQTMGLVDANSSPDVKSSTASQSKIVLQHKPEVVLMGINQNSPIASKVDTGAEMCCLHGTEVRYSEVNNMCQFTHEGRRYTLPLDSTTMIKTADGGTKERPVVKLNVVIDGNRLDRILFNINDRSDMDEKVLIGNNLLREGNFVVEPPSDNKFTECEQLVLTSNDVLLEALTQHMYQELNQNG